MGETSGILKVRVVKGKRLAVRDFRTSDPYVVLRLGDQVVKTRVINSNLNPVWDEELSFTITCVPRLLKLAVLDKDTFSSDDKMGDAEIDLQPLAAAVRMRKVLKSTPTGTQIRRLVASKDNCLAKDSCIRYVDGNIIQDVCLRLQNVETGELELTLKWVDLPGEVEGKA